MALLNVSATSPQHLVQRSCCQLIQPLARQDASFDVVTCMYGLFMVPDHGAALREAVRVLRPGGLLAFCVWGPDDKCQLPQVDRDCSLVSSGIARRGHKAEEAGFHPPPCNAAQLRLYTPHMLRVAIWIYQRRVWMQAGCDS